MALSKRKTGISALVSLRLVSFMAIVFLAAGAVQATEVNVHKTMGCMCCDRWAEHLRSNGHLVTITAEDNLGALKEDLGIPVSLWACHTAMVEGYVIEGHVPDSDIARLLQERPDAIGLAVAGMPVGSPGMEMGDRTQPYQVILFRKNGRSEVYASH